MLRRTDRRLLAELMASPRATITALARRLGVSRQAVAKRLRRLSEAGVVKFTAMPNAKALGLSMRAYILVRVRPDSEARRRFKAKVRGLKQVSRAHYLYGRFDAIVEALVRDQAELARLVKSLHRVEGVLETETYIVREDVKDRPLDPFLKALRAA